MDSSQKKKWTILLIVNLIVFIIYAAIFGPEAIKGGGQNYAQRLQSTGLNCISFFKTSKHAKRPWTSLSNHLWNSRLSRDFFLFNCWLIG